LDAPKVPDVIEEENRVVKSQAAIGKVQIVRRPGVRVLFEELKQVIAEIADATGSNTGA
jgi:hypothetical protein